MIHTKKIVLVPQEEQANVFETEITGGGGETANSIRRYAAERQRKMLNVVLRIATFGGYDEKGRIKAADGSFIDESDIVPLLSYALSPGRHVKGLDHFVDLLARAGVDPSDILNVNVRELLIKRLSNSSYSLPRSPTPPTEPHETEELSSLSPEEPILPPPPPLKLMVPQRGQKRQHEDSTDPEPPLKRAWVTSNFEDEYG